MGTVLIGLACLLGGILVGLRIRQRCADCFRPIPTHCDDCIAIWRGVEQASRVHSEPARSYSEWA